MSIILDDDIFDMQIIVKFIENSYNISARINLES